MITITSIRMGGSALHSAFSRRGEDGRSQPRRARPTALAQLGVFVLSGSVALLADLIHNTGDALAALPLGAAFLLRSE